jgi:hypothetical protein
VNPQDGKADRGRADRATIRRSRVRCAATQQTAFPIFVLSVCLLGSICGFYPYSTWPENLTVMFSEQLIVAAECYFADFSKKRVKMTPILRHLASKYSKNAANTTFRAKQCGAYLKLRNGFVFPPRFPTFQSESTFSLRKSANEGQSRRADYPV